MFSFLGVPVSYKCNEFKPEKNSVSPGNPNPSVTVAPSILSCNKMIIKYLCHTISEDVSQKLHVQHLDLFPVSKHRSIPFHKRPMPNFHLFYFHLDQHNRILSCQCQVFPVLNNLEQVDFQLKQILMNYPELS